MRRRIFGMALLAMAAAMPIYASADEEEDKDVAQQIATILRDSGKMENYSVGVKYKDGTVWLAGRVSSKQQMAAALEVISDIEGIDKIVNSLSVAPAPKGMAKGKSASNVQLAAAQQAMPAPPPQQQRQARPMQGGVAPAGYQQLPGPGGVQPLMQGAPQMAGAGRPMPAYVPGPGNTQQPACYDQPNMPNYAWPSYAANSNYAAVTYPKQYSATAWPFIGPFYPYPQVPLGWRKVSLEWDDGWWFLDFDDRSCY